MVVNATAGKEVKGHRFSSSCAVQLSLVPYVGVLRPPRKQQADDEDGVVALVFVIWNDVGGRRKSTSSFEVGRASLTIVTCLCLAIFRQLLLSVIHHHNDHTGPHTFSLMRHRHVELTVLLEIAGYLWLLKHCDPFSAPSRFPQSLTIYYAQHID